MRFLLLTALLVFSMALTAQVNYTANDQVVPYAGQFRMGLNMGYYPGWDNRTLADISAGNPAVNQLGVGAKSVRVGLYEEPFEYYGYNLNTIDFTHYNQLGMGEYVALIGLPSADHRDYLTNYCPGEFSAFHSNLYLPIWDGGANGTPYNDDNYLAAYLYKTAEIYKDDVRFWEIWNEPGFDLRSDVGGVGWRDQTYPGNWWLEGPPPCDNILHAPIYHYIRVMRIAWEVIKTVDPDSYVCLGSVGYQSFLNAMLRNTDNPNNGDISPDYPLTAGAYFDCITFHSYPHFDGSTTNFDQQIFERHSDAAADGTVWYRDFYQEILDQYGYNGVTYPKKEWIITEINSPRQDFQSFGFPFFAGQDAQINHLLKAYMVCKVNKIHNMQVFNLIDRQEQANATYEFDLMGMYKPLNGSQPYNNVQINDEGIAMRTISKLLFDTEYDDARSQAMNVPAGARGYAFKRPDGSYIYAVWARTMTDLSENAFATYSFPASFNLSNVTRYEWDWGSTNATNSVASQNIFLNARPVFFTDSALPPACALSAFADNITCDDNGTPSNPNDDTFTFDLTVNGSNASSAYTVSYNGVVQPGTFAYGTPQTFGPYSISSGVAFTITDDVTTTCVTEIFVPAPPACSNNMGSGGCASASDFPWHDWIANVKIATLDNASDKASYSDFTSLSTDLAAGQNYPITLTTGYSWVTFNDYYRVWIDFDKNGDFDASEQVFEGILNAPPNGTATGVLNGALSIPTNAATGATLMRVSMQRDAYPAPCGDFDYGEVEDYGVNITSGGSTTCTLSAQVSAISCMDNNTPNDSSDDQFTYTLTVVGNNASSSWNTTVNGQAISGTYGVPMLFGPYNIADGDILMQISDNTIANCSTTATATAPASCSNGGSSSYCGNSSDFPWHEWIEEVSIGAFSHSSGKTAYSDFTGQTIPMSIGQATSITLTTGFSWETHDEYWSVWIDFDKNGIFDTSELVFEKTQNAPPNGTANASSTGTITVPASASAGTTRMRIAMQRGASADPCGSVSEGEVEDYTVDITTVSPIGAQKPTVDQGIFLEAQVYGASVQLSWQSDNPQAISRFFVEKSVDGGTWERIAALPLEQAGVHQFTDFDPADGLNHYRIVAAQLDGRESQSPERKIRLQNAGLRVFPNPTAGKFTVDMSSAVGRNALLLLYSHTGQLKRTWVLENVEFAMLPIDLSDYPSGQYFLLLNVDGRQGESLKIVKQ